MIDSDKHIESKVKPIAGDLLKKNLALNPEDEKEIIENVNVIINCAASVDFNARLDEAISSNIIGTLEMLSLAKKIKNLESFVHVSTAYTNSDKSGLIEEKVYDSD